MESSGELGSQGMEALSLEASNGAAPSQAPLPATPFRLAEHQPGSDLEDAIPRACFGVATNPGGRPYQDDRATAFSVRLRDGRRLTVGAVLDGHHGHHLAQLVADALPHAFRAAAEEHADLTVALTATVRALDDAAFRAHLSGSMPTGGTTLILHVFTSTHLFTANVGDCKAVLSSRGAPEALSEAHNPPVGSERARFEAAGVPCSADHIGGSDINVCRTLGDYDLGAPLKWRAAGGAAPLGPLIPDPEISVRALDALDEFVVTASDGLWDYYSPESSVVTEARRALRANANDAQACAEWLVTQALVRQRGILHAGTQGDNVTVMLIQLRPLPSIPRSSASRLNLRRAASEDSGPAAAGAGLSSPPLTQ